MKLIIPTVFGTQNIVIKDFFKKQKLMVFVDWTFFFVFTTMCFLDPDGDSNSLVESCQTLRSLTGRALYHPIFCSKKKRGREPLFAMSWYVFWHTNNLLLLLLEDYLFFLLQTSWWNVSNFRVSRNQNSCSGSDPSHRCILIWWPKAGGFARVPLRTYMHLEFAPK